MEGDNGSLPQRINIPSFKPELNRPVNEPTLSEHHISCSVLRENDNERARMAALGIELMLTDAEMVGDAFLQFLTRAEP
jgi:hypothetical protein